MALKSEITFLRNELQSKDKIIELLIKDKQDYRDTLHRTFNDRINMKSCDDEIHVHNKSVRNNNLSLMLKKDLNKADVYEENKNSSDKIVDVNKHDGKTSYVVAESNKNKNKNRSITIIGDSLLKDIKAFKMRNALSSNEKIYIKSFPGATTEDMKDYIKPSLKYNPDLVILHTGTNSLRSEKLPEGIADDIMKIALETKTDENDVAISGIIPRSDDMKLNAKGIQVNDFLKIKTSQYGFGFIANDNFKTNFHLNNSGLHLNFTGTNTFGNNLLNYIKI